MAFANAHVGVDGRAALKDQLDSCISSDSTFPRDSTTLKSLSIALSICEGGSDSSLSSAVEYDIELSVLARTT